MVLTPVQIRWRVVLMRVLAVVDREPIGMSYVWPLAAEAENAGRLVEECLADPY